MRDLKLGANHIDREQLRRNALLNPRFPTQLLELTAKVEDVDQAMEAPGVDLFGTNTIYKIKCVATVAIAASDEEMQGNVGYTTEDGSIAETYREEWVVHRSLKEFQTLHKHLKMQISTAESSGTAGSRLVGAATAAFAATTALNGRNRQRQLLLPSLAPASKAGPLGMTKKANLKRIELLNGYLGYLLSSGHLLNRSSELLVFLGASFPLPPAVQLNEKLQSTSDPLGRTEMRRSVLTSRTKQAQEVIKPHPALPAQKGGSRAISASSAIGFESDDEDFVDDDEEGDFRKSGRDLNMIPAVRNKVDRVKLAQVRNRIFDLLRYQFGFENASFARNRLLAALKTASFAVTSAAEFRRTLYKLHVEHVNSESIAGLIDYLVETLWPNGIFFESSPALTPEEQSDQAAKAKELLLRSFPDQVRAILGQELTKDGMDMLHEMLQNRLVVKSMAYMLFDFLWLEVFPEIGDVLPCGAALDIKK
jgi:Sorting nexin C terminal